MMPAWPAGKDPGQVTPAEVEAAAGDPSEPGPKKAKDK